MKFFVLLLAICAATVFADEFTKDEEDAWVKFKTDHGKLFLSKGKEAARKRNFMKTRSTVQKLKAAKASGEISFTPKMYHHADLSTEEFVSRFGGFNHDESANPTTRTSFAHVRGSLPANFDARNYGWVNPVRNQEQCGSCWTFSTMACIEAGYAMRYRQNIDLAEQHLVDCGKNGGDGCQGGHMIYAFDYLSKYGGPIQESQYPYTATFGQCRAPNGVSGVVRVGTTVYPAATADDIKAAIMQYGTLAIAVDCGPWQVYGDQIFDGDLGRAPNHAVNVVGWGNRNGQEYWIVRNSWGEGWGNNGYIYLDASSRGGYNLQNTWAVNLQ